MASRELSRIFPYLGSKRQLLSKILPIIPPHKIYHEGFLGGGAILLSKPETPGVKNIGNDLDKNLIGFYRNFSCAKVDDCKKIKNVCGFAKEARMRVRKGSSNVCDQIAARRFSIVSDVHGGMKTEECKLRPIVTRQLEKRCPEFERRLRATKLTSLDFEKSARRADGPNTLHLFDPPYPGTTPPSEFEASGASPARVCALARKLKGKVIVTYNDDPSVRAACSGRGLYIKEIPSKHRSKHVTKGKAATKELLISNFPLRRNGN